MPATVLRDRSGGEAPAVTNMELFFDLVYVFAVTQLSHHLLAHLTVRGAVETLVLFLAVWWAWNYTAWATNWIDPDRPAVRGVMVVLMLISLVMSAKIPRAFGAEGLGFATAYVALQTVRSAFMVVAFRGQRMGRNYAQLLAWTGIAGIAWIAGAFVQGDGACCCGSSPWSSTTARRCMASRSPAPAERPCATGRWPAATSRSATSSWC